jgi:hypothetical protein
MLSRLRDFFVVSLNAGTCNFGAYIELIRCVHLNGSDPTTCSQNPLKANGSTNGRSLNSKEERILDDDCWPYLKSVRTGTYHILSIFLLRGVVIAFLESRSTPLTREPGGSASNETWACCRRKKIFCVSISSPILCFLAVGDLTEDASFA